MNKKPKYYSPEVDDLMFEKVYFDAWVSEAPMYTEKQALKLAKDVLEKNKEASFDVKGNALFEVGIWANYRREVTLKGKKFRLPLAYRNVKGEISYLQFGVEGKAGPIDE